MLAQKRRAGLRKLRDAGTDQPTGGLGCADRPAARDAGAGQGAGPEPGSEGGTQERDAHDETKMNRTTGEYLRME